MKAAVGVGAIVHFTFAGDFNPDMRVTALEPPALVCWECVDGTIVRFRQDYARELSDDDCGIYNFN